MRFPFRPPKGGVHANFFLMLLADPVFQELNWRLVAERRMLPLSVVEDLYVLEAGGLHLGMSGKRIPCTRSFLKLLNQLSVGALSQQFPLLSRHQSAASTVKPAFRCHLDPVAQGLVAQPEFPANHAHALPILDALDSQFVELDRVCLLQYLHFLPSKSDANFRSPLADEISGEANAAKFVAIATTSVYAERVVCKAMLQSTWLDHSGTTNVRFFLIQPDRTKMFFNKTLMITGGTAFFGNAALSRFLETGVKEIRIFSRDEKNHEDMRISTHSRIRGPKAWMKVCSS